MVSSVMHVGGFPVEIRHKTFLKQKRQIPESPRFLRFNIKQHMCHGQKSLYWGVVIQSLIGNPYNG